MAVVPAALPMVATVTQPLHVRHPDVQFTILSRPAHDIPLLLENLEIDAAITYMDTQPNSRYRTSRFIASVTSCS